jgi:mannose-6-phosphate isomerase-like protein (cupin superfamily)
MEIRRFGFGHRRPDGPTGSRGVHAAAIHGDARGSVTELAFGRKANLELHMNTSTTLFIVIEGGGFVRVGDETERVFAGESILWPAGVPHSASTDLSEMRAIVVELLAADDPAARAIHEGMARAIGPGTVPAQGGKADGRLASDGRPAAGYDRAEGEPI